MEDLRKNLLSQEGALMLTAEEVDTQEERIADQKIRHAEEKIEAILKAAGVLGRTISEKTENHQFLDIITKLQKDPELAEVVGIYNIEDMLERLVNKLRSITEAIPAHLAGEGKKFHELRPKEARVAGLLLILYHRANQLEIVLDDLSANGGSESGK